MVAVITNQMILLLKVKFPQAFIYALGLGECPVILDLNESLGKFW